MATHLLKFSSEDYIKAFAILAFYVLAAQIDFSIFMINNIATLSWLPPGIALAFLYMWGVHLWPAVFVAAYLVNVFQGASFLVCCGIALGNTLEALCAIYILKKLGFHRQLDRIFDVIILTFLGAGLGAFIAATIGVATLWLNDSLPSALISLTWITWWAGDFMSNLKIAPFIWIWSIRSKIPLTLGRSIEILALTLSLIIACYLIFIYSIRGQPLAHPFLIFPLLVWTATRFGQKGVITTTLLISFVATYAILHDTGPFIFNELLRGIASTHIFTVIITFSALILGAAVTEKKNAIVELQKVNAALDLRIKERTYALEEEIDKQRETENQLMISEKKFRSLAETAHEAIITCDKHGKIDYFSPGAENMFEYTTDDIHGQSALILIPQRYYKDQKKFFETYDTKETTIPQKTLFTFGKTKNGHEFPIEVSIARWTSNDDLFFTAIIRDITERYQIEKELKRSNEELESFGHVISHDLQEPLRMITNYLGLLRKRYQNQLGQDADEFIDFAIQGAFRMSSLIRNLLTYSTLGKRIPFEQVSCENILQDALQNLEVAIQEHRAVVTHDPLPVVTGHTTQLLQVFQNILDNALKYHGSAPPHIHISATKLEKEYLFSIRDNGIGIEEKNFDRIFKLMQRLHTQKEYPGIGIGLALCKRIIEMHNGHIYVESELGKGATFYFTIPHHQAE